MVTGINPPIATNPSLPSLAPDTPSCMLDVPSYGTASFNHRSLYPWRRWGTSLYPNHFRMLFWWCGCWGKSRVMGFTCCQLYLNLTANHSRTILLLWSWHALMKWDLAPNTSTRFITTFAISCKMERFKIFRSKVIIRFQIFSRSHYPRMTFYVIKRNYCGGKGK